MLEGLGEILKKLYEGEFGVAEDQIPSKCIENTHSVVKKFIESAIFSNNNLKMFSKSVDDMVKTQLLHWQLYVDYSKVLEIFKQPEYYDSNLRKPDPFIEMLCLLNFVEQIIVLMMPQRKKCHGINEIQEFLKSAVINVIQYVDDIDELFNQYYVFNSLNIIPKFDIDKIENQNSFINGIKALDLLNKYDKYNGLANQEWVKLLSNVYFRRYSPFARLKDFKDELLIINNQELIDTRYKDMKNCYYEYLRTKFSKFKMTKKGIKDVKDKKPKILDLMTDSILKLENSIESITVYISEFSYKENLQKTLKLLDIYRNSFLKKEVYKLINLIKLKKFVRSDMIKQLKKIQMIIEADVDNSISLRLWYDDFLDLLNSNMKIQKIDSNESFNTAVETIMSNYTKYIDYYVSMIESKIAKENSNLPIQYNDKKLQELIGPYIERLEQQEWKKLTGME